MPYFCFTRSRFFLNSWLHLCLCPVTCVPKWCQYLLIVHSWLSLCLRHVSCVPNGVSVSWLSILDCLCVFVLCFVFLLCLVYPNDVSAYWLSILDCPFVFVLCLVLPNGVSVSWLYLCLWDLRIPKGLSGAINRKRTNNTMAKKCQTIIYQALCRKQKI